VTRSQIQAEPAVDTASGIDTNGIYPLVAFRRRMRVGRHFMRSAVGAGLKIRRHGGRAFVTGADFLRFLEGQPEGGGDE
jgi:hypothetical protein